MGIPLMQTNKYGKKYYRSAKTRLENNKNNAKDDEKVLILKVNCF